MTILNDGTRARHPLRIGEDNRAWTHAVTESESAEISRDGKLYGFGTGTLTLTGSESVAPMLWGKNDDPNFDWKIYKIIYGWNGGSTTWLKTCFCLISYQTTVPTGASTSIDANIENIKLSGPTAPVVDGFVTAYKWNESGSSGMTGTSGGYGQISNRIAKGDTSLQIGGEIILGQNDTIEISVTPEEAGEFQVAIVYGKIPVGGRV